MLQDILQKVFRKQPEFFYTAHSWPSPPAFWGFARSFRRSLQAEHRMLIARPVVCAEVIRLSRDLCPLPLTVLSDISSWGTDGLP